MTTTTVSNATEEAAREKIAGDLLLALVTHGMERMDEKTPDVWGLVEIMGHQRVAGRLSDHSMGGTTLLRVDIPAVLAQPARYAGGHTQAAIPAHTVCYGGSAIYKVSFVSEETARLLAGQIRAVPVSTYDALEAIKESGAGPALLGRQFDPGDDDDHYGENG